MINIIFNSVNFPLAEVLSQSEKWNLNVYQIYCKSNVIEVIPKPGFEEGRTFPWSY